jgi:hypothetical protein
MITNDRVVLLKNTTLYDPMDFTPVEVHAGTFGAIHKIEERNGLVGTSVRFDGFENLTAVFFSNNRDEYIALARDER